MVFISPLLLVTLEANMPPSIMVNILIAKMLASVPLSNSPAACPSSTTLAIRCLALFYHLCNPLSEIRVCVIRLRAKVEKWATTHFA